jgi:hypothetical protein
MSPCLFHHASRTSSSRSCSVRTQPLYRTLALHPLVSPFQLDAHFLQESGAPARCVVDRDDTVLTGSHATLDHDAVARGFLLSYLLLRAVVQRFPGRCSAWAYGGDGGVGATQPVFTATVLEPCRFWTARAPNTICTSLHGRLSKEGDGHL